MVINIWLEYSNYHSIYKLIIYIFILMSHFLNSKLTLNNKKHKNINTPIFLEDILVCVIQYTSNFFLFFNRNEIFLSLIERNIRMKNFTVKLSKSYDFDIKVELVQLKKQKNY